VSYESRTVADQHPALLALGQIRRAFGHLPAATFGTSPIYPAQLDVSLHANLGDFEAWREALGFLAAAVKYRTQRDVCLLTITGPWGGATIELSGYGPLPKADVDGGDAL
jgi:hypothetical protein